MLKQKEMDKAGGARAKELAAQAEELKAARAQVRPKPQTALSPRHRGRPARADGVRARVVRSGVWMLPVRTSCACCGSRPSPSHPTPSCPEVREPSPHVVPHVSHASGTGPLPGRSAQVFVSVPTRFVSLL